MKVAYVTTYNPLEKYRFSGLGYHILKALEEEGLHIELIGPLRERFKYFLGAKKRLIRIIFNKTFLRERDLNTARYYAYQVEQALANINPDIVFSPGTIPISFVNFRAPIVFWTDATFAGMVDFYPQFKNLSKISIRNGNQIEQSALERTSLAVYTSEWAAESAIKHYSVNQSKIRVVPFGANFESMTNFDLVKRDIADRSYKECTLLFIGVDWHRKGGDKALKIANKCNQLGLKTNLIIAGCEPQIAMELPEFVKNYGYIDKSTEEGRKRIQKIYAQSHFFVMPSRAECTPVAFSEANSYGVPCISTTIGGIPSIIKSGINGQLFSPYASIADYCDYILRIFNNYSLYRELANSAYDEYYSRLNWNISGKKVKNYLDELVQK